MNIASYSLILNLIIINQNCSLQQDKQHGSISKAPAFSLRGWGSTLGGVKDILINSFLLRHVFFLYTSFLRESGTLEWSCKRENLALICRISLFTAQLNCLDSPPLPATMLYKRSENDVQSWPKKVVLCSLRDSAC